MADYSAFKDPSGLVSARLLSVHGVWQQIAAGRMAPRRDEVAPAQIRGDLPWTFVMDVIADGADFRSRFAGDRVIQFMGPRNSGSLLSAYREQPFFDDAFASFAHCVAVKQPVARGPMPVIYPGREFLEIEVLLLPLSENGSDVTALFGAFDSWPVGTHSRPTP